MTPAISIIVPIYQAGRYLRECLMSLLDQDIDDYEIVCVDDGSTDGSAEIVRSLMKTHPCIRYFYQENSGVSAARNRGIREARGEYVMFVDADDTIKRRSLRFLLRKARQTGADLLVFGGQPDRWLLTPEWIKPAFFTRNRVFREEPLAAIFTQNGARPSVCNKMFRSALLRDCRFPEHIRVSEDQAFLFEVFPKASCIAFCSRCIYRYRITNEASAMHTIETQPLLFFENHLNTAEYIVHLWDEMGILKAQKQALQTWAVSFLAYTYKALLPTQRALFSGRLEALFCTVGLPSANAFALLETAPPSPPDSLGKFMRSMHRQLKAYGILYGFKSILSKIYMRQKGYSI